MEAHHDIVFAFAGQAQALHEFVQGVQLDFVELNRVRLKERPVSGDASGSALQLPGCDRWPGQVSADTPDADKCGTWVVVNKTGRGINESGHGRISLDMGL